LYQDLKPFGRRREAESAVGRDELAPLGPVVREQETRGELQRIGGTKGMSSEEALGAVTNETHVGDLEPPSSQRLDAGEGARDVRRR
jgi:hypothetical protein